MSPRVSLAARRALIAAALGWMLDAMDVLLYAFVLDHVRASLGIGDAMSGVLLAVPLAASAVGGAGFGWLADRIGRTRALTWSILVYAVSTAACGLVQSAWQLGLARVAVGLGMGGEWAVGAALVAETWPAAHRGKAMGLMQSAWAIGYAAAAGINALVLPRFGWRAVFLAGLAPALVTLWVRYRVEESPVWLAARPQPARAPGSSDTVHGLFFGPRARLTWIVAAMNAATMFGWWGLFTWIPSYLARPVSDGGAGLSLVRSSVWVALMQVGMWLGYVSFGVIADLAGRRRAYVAYLVIAAALVPVYAGASERELLFVGPCLAFFGTGYFSGFGAVTAELFPTRVRATAQGITYNVGRGLSALAPVTVGALAASHGLGAAFSLSSGAFLLAAFLWIWIPETRGRALQ
jgi:MFS family permease